MFDELGLPAPVNAECGLLSARYGAPLLCVVQLDGAAGQLPVRTRALGNTGSFAPLGQQDRYGEVCMVVRRRDGTLITARKEYYPAATFRLLTGGIGHGEPIEAALLREVAEETGLTVAVRRFLAAISYVSATSSVPLFYTFALLVDELSGTLGAVDPDERVAAFRMVPPAELPTLAAHLEQLAPTFESEIKGQWRDWGRFRAVAHDLVAEALGVAVPQRPAHGSGGLS